HPGGLRAGGFGAHPIHYLHAVENDALAAFRRCLEPDVQGRRQRGQPRFIVETDATILCGDRHQAVQRTRIEQVPAQLFREQACDCALASAAGTVDGNDGNVIHDGFSMMSSPARCMAAAKPGKDVSIRPVSRISTGFAACWPRMAKLMATRWSPWLSTVPPCGCPPNTRMPSARSVVRMPSAPSPSAIA